MTHGGERSRVRAGLVSSAALAGGLLPVAVFRWAVPHVPLVGLAAPLLAVVGPALGVYVAATLLAGRRTGRQSALLCSAIVIPVWMFLLWSPYLLAAGLLGSGFLSWRSGTRDTGL